MEERFSVADWQEGSVARFAEIMGNPEKSRNIQQSAEALTDTASTMAASSNGITAAAQGINIFTSTLQTEFTTFLEQLGGTLFEGIAVPLSDLQDSIKDSMAPIVEDIGIVASEFVEKLKPALEELGGKFADVSSKISDELLLVLDDLMPVLSEAADKFSIILSMLDAMGAFDINNSFFSFISDLLGIGGSSDPVGSLPGDIVDPNPSLPVVTPSPPGAVRL